MPEITTKRDKPLWEGDIGSLIVMVDGTTIAGITPQTPEDATNKFVALCEQHKDELAALCLAANERREWNMNNPGKGKDWPAFRSKERMVKRLCNEAGIIDS